ILGPGANNLAIDGNAASRVFYIVSGKTVSISGLTIANGSADWGGGIYNNHSTLTMSSCTLSANSAGEGGGIFNDARDGGSVTLRIGSTILNAGNAGENIFNDNGTVTSRGYNLSSDAAGGDGTTGPGGLLNGTGDIRNTNPKLGPLQDNGGPTFTHAPLPG